MSALSRWLISAALGLAAFTTAAAGNAGDVYGLCPKEQPILDLGPIVALTRVELGPLVPGPGGNGVVQVAYHYHRTDDNQSLDEPFDLVLTELGAGIAHVLPAAPGATGSLGFKVRSFTWDDNDVLYLGTVGGQVPYGDERAHLLSFDYRDWTRRDIAALFPDGVDLQLQGVSRGSSYSVQSMWRGHDGAVYGGMSGKGSGLFRYHPPTDSLSTYGDTEVGMPHNYPLAYNYFGCTDDQYVYLAHGKQPWVVLALHEASLRAATAGGVPYSVQPSEILFTFPENKVPVITQRSPSCVMRVTQGQTTRYYTLHDGHATEVSEAQFNLNKLDGPSFTLPDHDVLLDTEDTSFQNPYARIWSKPAASGAWSSAEFPVLLNRSPIQQLMTTDDGRVLGVSGPYGQAFIHDPLSCTTTVLGPTYGNVYSLFPFDEGGALLGGYPDSPLAVYNAHEPWSYQRGAPDHLVTNARSLGANARVVRLVGDDLDTTHLRALTRDHRGYVYAGAHAERSRVGGGLAVLEVLKQEEEVAYRAILVNAIGAPTFAEHDVAGLSTTGDGDLVVYASRSVSRTPSSALPDARLFIYDATTDQIRATAVPFPGLKTLGALAPGPKDWVIGIVPGDPTLVYAFDAMSLTIPWQIAIQGQLRPKLQQHWDGSLIGVVGATGEVIRIDPFTGSAERIMVLNHQVDELTLTHSLIYFSDGGPNLFRASLPAPY